MEIAAVQGFSTSAGIPDFRTPGTTRICKVFFSLFFGGCFFINWFNHLFFVIHSFTYLCIWFFPYCFAFCFYTLRYFLLLFFRHGSLWQSTKIQFTNPAIHFWHFIFSRPPGAVFSIGQGNLARAGQSPSHLFSLLSLRLGTTGHFATGVVFFLSSYVSVANTQYLLLLSILFKIFYFIFQVYSQNIDGLELLAGLSPSKLIACHGGFETSHCINTVCRQAVQWHPLSPLPLPLYNLILFYLLLYLLLLI